jgi:hypothetical protein
MIGPYLVVVFLLVEVLLVVSVAAGSSVAAVSCNSAEVVAVWSSVGVGSA